MARQVGKTVILMSKFIYPCLIFIFWWVEGLKILVRWEGVGGGGGAEYKLIIILKRRK